MASYLPERPITTKSQDKLERVDFVRRLANALVDSDTGQSTGVVVGLTGSWGSGKSSILNMLDDEIRERHRNSYVVRFDPWLVSGRNDLISTFLAELAATIASHSDREAKVVKDALSALARYTKKLAPVSQVLDPSGSSNAIIQSGSAVTSEMLNAKDELFQVRAKVVQKIAALRAPIVVLIDELDRVEDDEIRAIAQLVRSVMDFPGVSYLLAYDQNRVIQALGTGIDATDRLERGRSYLEKIVQLPIALPILFVEERKALLAAELERLRITGLPKRVEEDLRFRALADLIAGRIISTPRDIKRVVGVFHVLHGMIGAEVDWVDLLGFSILQARFPATIDLIRADPDRYVDNPASERESMRRMIRREKSDDLFSEAVAKEDDSPELRKLVSFLFPTFSNDRNKDHIDPISFRRGLLTVIRLGLIPGVITKGEVEGLLRASRRAVNLSLTQFRSSEELGSLIERLDNFYPERGAEVLPRFWLGVADFLQRPKRASASELLFLRGMADQFASILEVAVHRNADLRLSARKVFEQVANQGDVTLVPEWLRHHTHALRKGGTLLWLENRAAAQWERKLASAWKADLLAGNLLDRLTDMQPIYLILDAEMWDDDARDSMAAAIKSPETFDSMVVLMFGGNHSVGKSITDRIFGEEMFESRVATRLLEAPQDDLVNASLARANEKVFR